MLLPTPSANDVWAFMKLRAQQADAFEIVRKDTPARWNAIRKIYEIQKQIGNYEPYPVDWCSIMTPIEYQTWSCIRFWGLPFCPQYPIGPYFVDFAWPDFGIVIECDGKGFHDAERDAKRDAHIKTLGFRVRRFTGRQIYLPADDPDSVESYMNEIAVLVGRGGRMDEPEE